MRIEAEKRKFEIEHDLKNAGVRMSRRAEGVPVLRAGDKAILIRLGIPFIETLSQTCALWPR